MARAGEHGRIGAVGKANSSRIHLLFAFPFTRNTPSLLKFARLRPHPVSAAVSLCEIPPPPSPRCLSYSTATPPRKCLFMHALARLLWHCVVRYYLALSKKRCPWLCPPPRPSPRPRAPVWASTKAADISKSAALSLLRAPANSSPVQVKHQHLASNAYTWSRFENNESRATMKLQRPSI